MDTVGIIIVNYNGWTDTIECLETVKQIDGCEKITVIVDNGSQNESVLKIRDWLTNNPAFKGSIIESSVNKGFAAGNNLAIKMLLQQDIRYFWLLNNDTVVNANSLVPLLRTMQQNEQIGFVGSKLLFYDHPSIIQAAGGGEYNPIFGHSRHYGEAEEDNGQWNKPLEPFYVNGASLLTKREVIEDIGLMNENFFMYGEEVEWQIRAKQRGWKTAYAFESRVLHKVSASINNADKRYFAYYYITRNAVIINRKYYAQYVITLILFNLCNSVIQLGKTNWVSSKAVLKGLFYGLKTNLGDFFGPVELQ